MKSTNALEVRRSLGRVLRKLEKGGEPIVVDRNGRPAAVLVSIAEFRERFADKDAAEERERIAKEILALRTRAKRSKRTVVEELRRLRGSLP